MKITLFFFFVLVAQLAIAQQMPPPGAGPSQQTMPVQQPNLLPPRPGVAVAASSDVKAVKESSKETDRLISKRVKDPFMIPNHLYVKLKKKTGDPKGEAPIDDSVEPKKRWPLKYYNLVGIIWNVKDPRAMILDKDRTMQVYRIRETIGNNDARITAIHNGEVVIIEKGNEIKMKVPK